MIALKAALPLLFLAASASTMAATTDDAQFWTTAAASGPIAGKLVGSVDTTLRFYDNASHLSYVIARGMLGWRLAPGVVAGAGYGYVRNTPEGRPSAHEHQAFQQLAYPVATVAGAKLQGRTRLEQRFFSNDPKTGWRLRQQLKLTVPLDGPTGLKGIVHTEAFVLLRQQGRSPAGLNQIRTGIGLGIPVTGKTSIEAGYLNQAVLPGDTRFNHVLAVNLVTGW